MGYDVHMSDYRRYFVPGGTYFFTLVTQRRAHLFTSALARRLLGDAMRQCFLRYPVRMLATVLLPNHLRALWTLPEGDAGYSLRWRWIKREFTRSWLALGGAEQARSAARVAERGRGVWQRRFWEHTIRDETDLEAHFDYIHYNPVRHGFVSRPRDWPWSTFHRWVRAGHYPVDWAARVDDRNIAGQGG
jgi:putative transposase